MILGFGMCNTSDLTTTCQEGIKDNLLLLIANAKPCDLKVEMGIEFSGKKISEVIQGVKNITLPGLIDEAASLVLNTKLLKLDFSKLLLNVSIFIQ